MNLKKSSVKKNLILQTIYQLLNTCLPLITSPYLARVLGAQQQGIFSYTQSIANYFTLIAMLGVVNYGTRTIAACGDDKKKRSSAFWNIYAFQVIMSGISIVAYIIYIIGFCRDNYLISVIQGFYILGSLIDINWLYFGVEKFDITVKRSIIIRILSLVCILLLVKGQADLWIYTVIMVGSTIVSNFILFKYLSAIVDIKVTKYLSYTQMISHIKPNLVLFVPLLAMSVYRTMDKTMLGLFSSYEETGYYYNADKIINIPIGIINGVGTVMLPRMTSLIESGKSEESDKVFNMSIEMIVFISVAMACGIAAISKEFTPIFFGKGFDPCINLICILAPVMVIKALSQTSRMQYLIPNHLENIFLQSVCAGLITNIIANALLIGKYGAIGAVIGTLVAEIVTCVWQYYRMRRYIFYLTTLLKSLVYVLFGGVMYCIVRGIAMLGLSGVICLIIEVTVGGIVYIALCLTYWKISNSAMLSIIHSNRKSNINVFNIFKIGKRR